MTFDRFLKRWISPPILTRWRKLARSFRGKSTVDSFVRHSNRLFVLANGPSLAQDLERCGDELLANDCLAVNFMALSDVFSRYRPNVYLLCDPFFFEDLTKMGEASRDKMRRLQDALVTKTLWPMTLVVADRTKDSAFVRRMECNPNVTILYYAANGLRPEFDGDFSRWRKGRCPPVYTVTNAAVFFGVYWGYRETWLLGADMSLHQMLRVDPETNRVYWQDEHFYGRERRFAYKDERTGTLFTMGEALQSIADMFKGYEQIRRFADSRGVRVVNGSTFSYIDAFERCPLAPGTMEAEGGE